MVFSSVNHFKPEVEFGFVFSKDGLLYLKEWRVTRVEEGRLLAHSWIYEGFHGKSEVTFELFEDETRLGFNLLIPDWKVFRMIHILQGQDSRTAGNKY